MPLYSQDSEDCRFLDFSCYVKKFIAWIILGLIINIVGYYVLTSQNWLPVNWVNNSFNKEQINYIPPTSYKTKCCERTNCTCSLGWHLCKHGTRQACCRHDTKGKLMKDTDMPICKCVKYMDPCADCKLTRKYTVNGKPGEYIYKETKNKSLCNNLSESSMDQSVYANPKNPNSNDGLSSNSICTSGICMGYIIFNSGYFFSIII